MAAFVDVSAVVYAMTGGGAVQRVNRWAADRRAGAAPSAPVAGRITSFWIWDGVPAGASSTAPSTATALSNTTNGALKQALPTAGKNLFLVAMTLVSNAVGSVIVYDRLSHQGGLSGVTTGAQTTNLPTAALTRNTTGLGVEPWLEIYTAIGATATTVTASYTDENGTTGNSTLAVAWGGTGLNNQDRIVPLTLASGDRGCRAVASVTNAATTATAGNFGVTLAYPLVTLPLPFAGVARSFRGLLDLGGPLNLGVDSSACIAEAWFANTTTVPWVFGDFNFVDN